MPKLKQTETQIICSALVAKIKHQMEDYGVKAEDLARVINGSRTTVYNRFREPEKMPLGDLIRLAKKLHIKIQIIEDAPPKPIIIGEPIQEGMS